MRLTFPSSKPIFLCTVFTAIQLLWLHNNIKWLYGISSGACDAFSLPFQAIRNCYMCWILEILQPCTHTHTQRRLTSAISWNNIGNSCFWCGLFAYFVCMCRKMTDRKREREGGGERKLVAVWLTECDASSAIEFLAQTNPFIKLELHFTNGIFCSKPKPFALAKNMNNANYCSDKYNINANIDGPLWKQWRTGGAGGARRPNEWKGPARERQTESVYAVCCECMHSVLCDPFIPSW